MMNTANELTKVETSNSVSKPAIGLIFCLLGVIASFGFTYYISQINFDSQKQFDELRRTLINIESQSFNAQLGEPDAFNQLFTSQQSVNTLITRLSETPFTNQQIIHEFSQDWEENNEEISKLLRAEQTIRLNQQLVEQMDSLFPKLAENTEELIAQLIVLNVEPNLVFLASHQLSLLQSIKSNLHHLDNKQKDATKTLQLIKTDSDVFTNTLKKLLNGDSSLNIKAVRDEETRTVIQKLANNFSTVIEIGARMNELMIKLNISKNAYNRVHDLTHNLFEKSSDFSASFTNNNIYSQIATFTGYGLAIICLFLAGTLLFSKKQPSEFTAFINDNKSDNNNNDTLANAIRELESKISPIAKGDFTKDIKVSHSETQSIATTMNYATRALRASLLTIGKTSEQVLNVAEETQATSIHLAKSSDMQAKHISDVTNAIQNMASHFARITQRSLESTELANRAAKMAEDGNLAVTDTIYSMRTINDDIDETASRIKKLGESSQEIGNIIELINEIADQTNILALNAAIKSSATHQAHEFGDVADEIQQLAERVTQATKKIESLVSSIQQDTNQAVLSMEQSSTDVINGSKLAEAAGNALHKIENVSSHLASFISDISHEAAEINQDAGKLSETMAKIKKLTDQNLASSKQTANLNGKLATLAQNQREAVNGFSSTTKENQGQDPTQE